MDIYGGASTTTPDNYFRIDDLLDFSNDEIFSSSAASTSSSDIHHHHISPPENSSVHQCYDPSSDPFINPAALSTDFTDHLSVPSDDVAELEWLSRFVDDSFMDFPANALTGAAVNGRSDASFPVKARGKRTKGTFTNATASAWITSSPAPEIGYPSKKEISSGAASPPPTAEGGGGGVRRCTHCASEKTPQWRTGPLGPKTLCNACGVRFKSGRLVPEYRPAASPTFVLTQHSNSHRKVMELRRQKEMLIRGPHHQINNQHQVIQQVDEQQHIFHPHHRHHQQDFEVC